MIFHLLLLAMIVSWKPPQMGQVAKATDVSLISSMGQIAATVPPSIAPILAPIDPKPIPTAAKPSVVTAAAPDLGSSLLLKLKPEPNRPDDQTPMLVDAISGAPSLTAEPISIVPQPAQASPAPMQTTGGARCQLLENLRLGLQGSDAVKAALLLIPKQSLSVANAILLWNGRWIDESAVGGPRALAPIEQSVVETIGQTPPVCQNEVLHGVRFITVGDSHDTMVLAFGSADWRWADLFATVSPPT